MKSCDKVCEARCARGNVVGGHPDWYGVQDVHKRKASRFVPKNKRPESVTKKGNYHDTEWWSRNHGCIFVPGFTQQVKQRTCIE